MTVFEIVIILLCIATLAVSVISLIIVLAKKNKEETILKINEEAAKEIIRQLQLRNITGMIIIDFINMKVEASKDSIYRAMNEYAKYDYTQCSVVGFTKLGLMEMTRKKQHKPIYEILR